MSLAQELHQQIHDELLKQPGKIYTRGVRGSYGLLVRAPGGKVEYRFVSHADFFEAVPDFPREHVAPDRLLIAVGDDVQTSAFIWTWDEVKTTVADWPEK